MLTSGSEHRMMVEPLVYVEISVETEDVTTMLCLIARDIDIIVNGAHHTETKYL